MNYVLFFIFLYKSILIIMRKQLLAGAFILACFFTANAQKISQNNNPNAVTAGGSLGCPTAPNVYSRSFVLADFNINADWPVSQVEFGLQDYTTADSPITITLYTSSQDYPTGYPASLTQLATTTVSYTETGQSLNVLKQVPITAVVPAGSELVVEISGAFFIGGNTAGSTAPSYLLAVGCGATTPTDVTDLGDFENVNFLINVTGGTTGLDKKTIGQVSVFPNPSSGIVTITTPESISVTGATITDVTGKVTNANVSGNTVNISEYAAGVYFLNIKTDSGNVTKKIIKE